MEDTSCLGDKSEPILGLPGWGKRCGLKSEGVGGREKFMDGSANDDRLMLLDGDCGDGDFFAFPSVSSGQSSVSLLFISSSSRSGDDERPRSK